MTRLLSQRLGALLAYSSFRLGLSPSAVTALGGVVGLAASFGYALGPPGLKAQLALLASYQLAYGFDCADGQLARATRRASEFGAWFDVTVDFVRYIAIGFGILTWLLTGHHLGLMTALVTSGTFLVGTVVSLHTSISLQRQATARGAPAKPAPSLFRDAARTVIDTPFLLLMLCALRDSPLLLTTFIICMGLGYTLIALILARRRLAR